MNLNIETPWYKYYDGIREHLDYPDISIYRMLKESADKHPNCISYEYYGTKRTYREFLKEIEQCAKAFKALGIEEKEKVSICMPNTPEAVIAFYAINRIGAVANMIHPLSAENEIKHYLNISQSRYIISIDITLPKLENIFKETPLKQIIVVSPGDSMPFSMKAAYRMTKGRKNRRPSGKEFISWKEFVKQGEQAQLVTEDKGKGQDVAAILYSGGTTGYPKGIELTNLNFNALAMQGVEACACLITVCMF